MPRKKWWNQPYYSQEIRNKHTQWREMARWLRISRPARTRLEWIIYYQTRGSENVAKTARHFGIARKTFYTWYCRFDDANLRTLEDHSRAPQRRRQPDYTGREAQQVEALRRLFPTAGRDKLVILYAEEYGTPIKPWSLRRIVRDYRLYAQRAIRSRHTKALPRAQRKKRITELEKKPYPGFLVEVDTIAFYDFGHKRYVLTAIDHYSRLAFAYMYPTKASRNAADFLKRLLLLFGRVENLHIDNGSEFKKEFEKAAEKLGVILYHARPYRAQDKPLIERFNGIVQQEYIDLGHYSLDVEYFNRYLIDWLIYYNFKRPHHALGLKRPAEFANMQREKVLPMSSPITEP